MARFSFPSFQDLWLLLVLATPLHCRPCPWSSRVVHHLPFRQVYRAGSLRISGNCYFEAVPGLFSFTLRFHFLAYWNLCVIARTILSYLQLLYLWSHFSTLWVWSPFIYFFCFPLNCLCCQLSITAVLFLKLCLFTEFCGFGGWSVLRLMRSFIKKGRHGVLRDNS